MPSYKTVMRIIRDEETINSYINSAGCRRKEAWCTMNPNLEQQMKLWVDRIWKLGIFLTDRVMQEKAVRLQFTMND